MLGHPGVGGVPLVAACCGTVGISAALGRWRRPGTACAWGHNLGLYPRGCPSIWGSPLGRAHCRPRSLLFWVRCRRAVGGVVSPVGAATGRCGPLSPCPLVMWFALLVLMWVRLVPGWAPCLCPESGRGPSSLVLGRGGCVDVVFCGSFPAVCHPRHVL